MNLRAIHKALVLFLCLVSMLMPAKMGMGQVMSDWKEYTPAGTIIGGLAQVQGVVPGPNGDLYVADSGNNRVLRLDSNGAWSIIGTYGTGVGEFKSPRSLEFDALGNLWVADYNNHRLQYLDPSGTWHAVGEYGTGPGQFKNPTSVKFHGADLWVTEERNNRLQKWVNRQTWIIVGELGTLPGQFNFVTDIAFAPNGDMYVTDYPDGQYGRLQKLDTDGVWTIVGPVGNLLPGEFLRPMGLDFDKAGRLWVSDTIARKLQRRNEDGSWTVFGEGGTGVGQFGQLHGIQFDNDGRLFVASSERVISFVPDYIEPSAPTSTFSTFPSSTWSNSNVAATITSTDNVGGTGVKEIHYSINMGAEQIVSSSTASFTLSDNGTHSISYFAVDIAGNTETTKLATVKIDKIAPVTTLSRNAGLITLSATDAHSGVAKIEYQVNGGAVADYSVPFADTIHKVTYWAEDVAGNLEASKTDIFNAGVQAISVTQPRLNGGTGVVGTVTLDKAAGVGGTVINLASSLPGVAVVDATVTVPEGATTASFDIDANPVAIDTSVSITASIYETSQSALVTVQAPMPSSVTWSVSPVVGGTSTTGTLTLTSPAPTGGTTVSLASSSLSALVGSSVTIPAGAMTTTFNVTTNVVSNDTSAVISATVYGVKLKSTLSILGPKVSSVSLASASIASTTTTTGTVTLSTNAPVGGKVVNLSSSDSAVASVPVSVTVAAGTRTANFTITAGTVNANTNATITATTNNSSGTATITVTPPAAVLSSLTTVVTAVTGGRTVTGTVTLTSAAPMGGAVVTLASSSTTIGTVPASVTVAAGATSATFTITTRPVTAASALTITATRNGVSKTATITVNPVRVVSTLTLNPTSVRGGTNSTGTVTLTGIATEAVVVTLTSGTTAVARVPTSVTVPAGSTTATFTITTLTQTATRTSVITARTGTTSRTATLSVTR